MSFFITHRYGRCERDPPLERLHDLYGELNAEDDEHPGVSVTHESEWSLAAYRSGLVVWENVETDTVAPRHMRDVPRAKVLILWTALAAGDFAALEAEPWAPGGG